MPFCLRLPRRLYEAMLEQALAECPNECCGLLAGRFHDEPSGARIGLVVERYPLVNALASPVEFESEPRSMFEAEREMRRRGLEILAVYHSHPTSAAVPSHKDRARNYSPDIVNLIISFAGPQPMMRGWWLTAESQQEAAWECFDETP
ncbi:MAG TPA: M67 family metallopeptidase [Gemmataceae bacterium]|nr:M67 family metallopeptidase [Gemmataceae bacterium]